MLRLPSVSSQDLDECTSISRTPYCNILQECYNTIGSYTCYYPGKNGDAELLTSCYLILWADMAFLNKFREVPHLHQVENLLHKVGKLYSSGQKKPVNV